MLDSLQPLFEFTGYMAWVVASGLVAVCVLGLVVDYGWRSLRWLFGLPRGSSIWQEAAPDVPAESPEAKSTHATQAAYPAHQLPVASLVNSDATTGEQAAPEASRLQSMAWAAGEAPLTQPKATEGA